MRLPVENSRQFLPENWFHRLFVQAWYSRVHATSLDTYRVRSLDSLAIADEILSSLGNTNVPLYRTKSSCEEAVDLLRDDHILRSGWKLQTDRALAALTTAKASKDEDTTCPDYLNLAYHLRRLKSAATADYRVHVLRSIESALANNDSDAIYDLTGRLLTRLVNEGYSLEGLFGIVSNVLIRSTPAVDFARHFEVAKNKILASERKYQIILRLTGPSKPLPEKIGTLAFSQEPFDVSVDRQKKDSEFFQQGRKVYFARLEVSAREERSAGEAARDRAEQVMDALRFELVHDVIVIHDEFVYITQDGPAALSRIPSTVPNPRRTINSMEFTEFLSNLSDLDGSARFSSETKSKMASALRYYRMSLDTPQLQNRFINSWTALEYLAKDRTQKYIIDGVRGNVVPLLVIPYLRTLLADFRETLVVAKAQIPNDVSSKYVASSYGDLSLGQLLEVIRGSHFLQVQASCSAYPALQMALSKFREGNCDDKATAQYIGRHKRNVEWHLTRLYGARNDIVHSADTSTHLTLLCANLEYYVKLCIQEILNVASTCQDINSLEEIFAVQRQTMTLMLSDLKEGKDSTLPASLEGTIC